MKNLLTFFLTALLAFSVGWAEEVYDYLNRDFTGVTSGAGYSEWSGKTATSAAVYAGQSAGGNNSIQLRSNNNNSGIITTASGGKVKKVEISFNSNTTNGRIVDVYGKHTSYTSAADLYDESTQGTRIGSIVKGTTTSFTVSGDYEYIGIRSNSGALYITSITITWETGGSTPVETCATPTFSPAAGTYTEAQDVTISTTTSGASIYYTTDNSTPSSTNGTLYTGAINVSSTTTIKAIAVKTGNNDSQVAEATYTIETGGDSGSTIYRKVTSTDALTTGDYLIVYEGDNVAFDGSLVELNLDMANNTKSVAISNQTIETAENIYFTYNAAAGTLKSASGYYIGKINTSNGMNISATEPYTHTITIDNSGNAIITSTNVTNGPSLRFNSASNQKRFRYYGSGQQAIQLYKKDSTDPTLLATPTTLALTDIPYDGSSTSGTFTLTGTYLTQNVTMTFSGAEGFSIDPSTSPIVPVDGSVSQEYTVTYNGNSTSEVTATVTFTCGDLTETVTVTAKKATPPPASITISPNTQTFSDAAPAELTITGEYVSGNINASLATNTDWYLNPNTFGNTGGTATVTYNGRALSSTNTVTASASGATDATATVNYVADLYIVTDNGQTGNWNFNTGTAMTYNNGVYTTSFTANVDNTFILFARKLGNGVDWNTRYVFGPDSSGDWWLPTSGNGNGNIDLNDDDPIKIQTAGTYIITIDATSSPVTFTITKRNLGGDEFVLVTDTEDVTTDSEYVLVYSNTAAMGKTLVDASTDYLNSETSGFDVDVDVVTLTSDSEVNVFTLIEADGYFNIQGSNGKYIGTNGNNLALADEANGNAYKWSITIANDLAVIQNLGNSRFLAYNTSSPRFTTYATITSGSAQQYAALYKRGGTVGPVAPATPVISPESDYFTEDQLVTITCSTTSATIYYTINGGEPQVYTDPFNVDLDNEHTSVTIVAWAEKDDLISEQVSVTYTYYNGHVSSIAEFLALKDGEEAIFDNPVIVLFDYSQDSANGQEYIWVKDRTGYTQFFIAPQFDNDSVQDPQYEGTYNRFWPKYENGDIIPENFKVKKNYFTTGEYYQGQCYDWHYTFREADSKALADPEQVTLSELINNNPEDYNNRYLYINKIKITGTIADYGTYGKWEFYVAADENDDNVAEIYNDNKIVGYNKYNSPAWKNKQGQTIGVPLPTDGEYYNVKFIFQKYGSKYEIMPIEFTPWEDNSLRLEDLVKEGVENHNYKISNQLHAVAVTWDGEKDMFAIFAKDDGMYANKRYPATGQDTYLIRYENQNGTFINEVEQEDYDQSNWIEILIPSTITQVTSKTTDVNAYIQELGNLQSTFENKILNAGSVRGTYVNALNPTIEVTALPTVASLSTYEPNIYCTANFLMENLDTDGAQGNDGNYFMMDAKPHEFCKVVWAYYDNSNGNYFVIPAREGNVVNGHGFTGSFMANMSLCEDYQVYYDFNQIRTWFLDSNDESYNGQQTLYGFDAIIRKNPNANNSNGAPRRIQPGTGDFEQTPAYIVYPLNAGGNSNDNVVSVKEVMGNKAIESVHYYNMMGMEGKTPFEGINIVVTRYTDGSTSTIKVMK